MRAARVRSSLFVVAVLAASPLAALACPNCYASSDTRVLHTYYFSAFLLTLLPFAIIGSILMVARRVGRRMQVQRGAVDKISTTSPAATSPDSTARM
jgi:hypothetical protein